MRYLVLLFVFALTSCSGSRQRVYSVTELCPAFEAPVWKSVKAPKGSSSALIDKQKFAVTPNHKTYWFEARDDFIGLCILPATIGSPGCATAYATYQWKEEDWILQEQKVTICPS